MTRALSSMTDLTGVERGAARAQGGGLLAMRSPLRGLSRPCGSSLNFDHIPWTPEEDQAFDELSTAVDRCAVAASTGPGRAPSDNMPARSNLPKKNGSPARSANRAGLETAWGSPHMSRRKLSQSTVVPVLGILLCYTGLLVAAAHLFTAAVL